MKIGITGTHCTGKTTLLDALRYETRFAQYAFLPEVTRWVREIGHNINEDGTDLTQELILMRHIHNFWMYDRMITDRTMIDCYVYSKWLWHQDKISQVTMDKVESAFLRSINEMSYDRIIYLSPEFPLVNDSVRSSNQQWQNEIHSHFKQVIEVYDLENEFRWIHVTGSVDDRVKQVLRAV